MSIKVESPVTMRSMRDDIRREFDASGRTRCTRMDPSGYALVPVNDPMWFPTFCLNCGRDLETTGKGRGYRHAL